MDDQPKKNAFSALLLLAAAACTAVLYSWGFYQWIVPVYGAAMALLFLTAAAGTALFSLQKGRPKRTAVIRGVVTGALYTGVLSALTFLINNVITKCDKPWIAALTITIINFVLWLCWAMRFFAAEPSDTPAKQKTGRKLLPALLACCVLLGGCLPIWAELSYQIRQHSKPVAAPTSTGVYTETERTKIEDADLYVAPEGSDDADGTFEHPLATIEKARDLVRAMDKTGKNGITVALKAGEYRVSSLKFTAEDGGTESCPVTYRAYGDGEVILNGGLTLTASDFTAVTDEGMRSRFADEAKDNVVCADLTQRGLTAADWGRLVPMGSHTADKYDNYIPGSAACELFFNGKQMTLARYPNDANLKVVEILQQGYGLESSESNHAQNPDWETIRNPQTTIFSVDKKTADRINAYKSLDDVWIWEALIHEFSQSTVPLKSFDYENRAVEQKYVSRYGAVADSSYRIFNVPEELDAPGEWYLDRQTGMLYLWPDGDLQSAEVRLTVSAEDLITVTDAGYLRFDGLTISGSRGSGVVIRGNDITVSGCRVSEVSGVGVSAEGYRNTVTGCEIVNTGSSGIKIDGGDRPTLTSGENRVENNLVRGAGFLESGHGITVGGVGAVIAHNEVCDSPAAGIAYWGNNIIVEYNVVHDVELYTDDGAAIYTGRRWDCGGCVVRYNVMYNLGDEEHTPNGIYFDDGVSGQTAYGNLIVNAKGNGFLIGGGRDHNVYGNVLVNCKTPICYDDRSREAILHPESWFQHSREGMDMQQNLEAMPWRSELWRNAYPYTANWVLDYADTENPDFIPNPANSHVNGNLIVQYAGSLGEIAESVERFSDLTGNAVYKMNAMKKLFVDPANGDYTLRDDAPVFDEIPGFEPIPIGELGRY